MKDFLSGKWGMVAIVVLFLCVGGILGTIFSDDPHNVDSPKPSVGETIQNETQSTTQALTEPLTQAPIQPVTVAPTQAPTEKATEPLKITISKGWDLLSPNMKFVRNEDGVIVFNGAYYNHWTNGFLIAKTGVDFLSFHSGEPVWVTGKQEHIIITNEGNDYDIDFAWCAHMGEIGINFSVSRIPQGESGIRYVSPIPGNDRFVKVGITDGKLNYTYLVYLETLEIIDPLANLDPKYSRDRTVEISPDADKAIIYIESKPAILELESGAVKNLAELSGMENADTAYWASATQIVVVATQDAGIQEKYADAVLYDLTDGNSKELYRNARYGWFSDVGGLEHHGRMYCYYDPQIKKTVFVDSVTGTQGYVMHGYSMARQMGECGIEYYDDGICYLLKPDGTATPLFTTKAE